MTVLHAYDARFKGFQFGADTDRAVREQHDRNLGRAVEGVISSLGPGASAEDVELRRRVCRGTTLEVLRQECANLLPDLLAIGTHGRTGLAHAVFGSVAKSLPRNPPCDVVATRDVART